MKFGYSRISKGEDQNSLMQIESLKSVGCEEIYEESISGKSWNRPKLKDLLNKLRKGDVVIVWKLDRLSRSLKDLLLIIEAIEEKGAGFKSITEDIDTTSPAGRMMMQMVGSFSEFEREMIRERTKAGLKAARAEGRKGGRRPKLKPHQIADIVENVMSNRNTAASMARLYEVSEATISRIISKNNKTLLMVNK